jgi:hypothetical protein
MHRIMCHVLSAGLWLGLWMEASAGERLPIKQILLHPADYRSKVVTVEGRAKAVTTLPAHRGTSRCGGSLVYDSQMFALKDRSGTIGVNRPGTCLPNVAEPVRDNERLRIRGVVLADEQNPNEMPVIYADAIDRLHP